MAVQVLTDVFFSHGGTDLSDHVTAIRMSYNADEVETTAMGDTTHEFMGGLKNWDAEIEFNNDEAASSVMATLFSAVGSTATIIIRPDKSDGVSSTNPNYTGTALLVSLPPIAGGVGELSKTTASYKSAGALSRATS